MMHAERVFKVQHANLFQGAQSFTAAWKLRLALEKERAKRFARIGEAQRVGTVRSFFKGRCGFGPTVLSAVISPEGHIDMERHWPSYQEHVRTLLRSNRSTSSRAAEVESLNRTNCRFLGGDMLFALARTEDSYWANCCISQTAEGDESNSDGDDNIKDSDSNDSIGCDSDSDDSVGCN